MLMKAANLYAFGAILLAAVNFSSASVSPDGTCGPKSVENYSCVGSSFGDCCSKYGWCGSSSDFCAAWNCQSGNCDNPVMGSISPDGTCGTKSAGNYTCIGSSYGNCCSNYGWCGSTSDYCAAWNCQSGRCDNPVMGSVSPDGSCGPSSKGNYICLGSSYGNCCSLSGWCGSTSAFCGAGVCQSGNCASSGTTSSSSSTSTSTSTTSASSSSTSTTTTSTTSSSSSSTSTTSSSSSSTSTTSSSSSSTSTTSSSSSSTSTSSSTTSQPTTTRSSTSTTSSSSSSTSTSSSTTSTRSSTTSTRSSTTSTSTTSTSTTSTSTASTSTSTTSTSSSGSNGIPTPIPNGPFIKATFTGYGSNSYPGAGTCAAPSSCGMYGTKNTASINTMYYGAGPGQGAGSGCGRCWLIKNFTGTDGTTLYNPKNNKPIAQTTVVIYVDNMCYSDGGLCGQTGQSPTNQYGAQVTFNLCSDTGTQSAAVGSNDIGLFAGQAQLLSDCSSWKGKVVGSPWNKPSTNAPYLDGNEFFG